MVEPTQARVPRRNVVVTALGLTQILGFGTTLYLPAVLSQPIAASTGWALSWVVGGLSLGLLTAGLVSPTVGRLISRHGGRRVLPLGSALLAAGLGGLGLANTLPLYLAAWAVTGAGMGAGLYDAAFSTLGRLYGVRARSAITIVTLWGGFASTICWPLSAYLVDTIGWRGCCGVYAAMHLLLALPLHLIALPRQGPGHDAAPSQSPAGPSLASRLHDDLPTILLLAGVITIGGLIASVLSVHLIGLLQGRGLDLGAAVTLGALLGPAQVLARFGEMGFGQHYRPIWTLVASVALMAVGILLLLLPGGSVAAAALVIYGAGNGIGSIAKGTVPLALFGPLRYATVMGRIARPSLIGQALAPSLVAILVGARGSGAVLPILAGLALTNVVLVGLLGARIIPERTEPNLS